MAQLRSDMAGLHPEALRLLDFGGKGLKNVVVGLNLPESVSGDAVLYTRNDAWKFVDDLGRREDGEEGVVFPVKVKFRVALASGPQARCEAELLRKHVRNYQRLTLEGINPGEKLLAWRDSQLEGFWTLVKDEDQISLELWWEKTVRPDISLTEQDRQIERWKEAMSELSPLGNLHGDSREPSWNGAETLSEGKDDGAGPKKISLESRRDEGEGASRTPRLDAERRWQTAVGVLIQMADWMLAMHERSHRSFLTCRVQHKAIFLERIFVPLSSYPCESQPFTVMPTNLTYLDYLSPDLVDSSVVLTPTANALINSGTPMTNEMGSVTPTMEHPTSSLTVEDRLASLLSPDAYLANIRYAAPEVLPETGTSFDQAADIYTWGMVAYELCSGQTFVATAGQNDIGVESFDPLHHTRQARIPSLSSILWTIPEELSRVIDRAISIDAGARYPNLQTLLYDLHKVKQIADGTLRDGFRLNFNVGEIVPRSTFHVPTALLDRDSALEQLNSAYEKVKHTHRPAVTCVYGKSGSGKTFMVQQWAGAQEQKSGGQECLVGFSKSNQHLVLPLAGFINVFCSLLDRVFSDPLEDAAAWKRDLLNAVAGNTKVFLSLLPAEWQNVLAGHVQQVEEDDEAIDWASYLKQFRTWSTQLLRLFATQARPLIIVLDDYQWLETSERELWTELVASPARRVDHCLLVLSYRTEVQDVPPDLGGFRATMIRANTFSLKTVSSLLKDSFNLDNLDETWQALGDFIVDNSLGNPLFSLQILSALVRDEILHFDYTTSAWQIEIHRLIKYQSVSSEQFSERTLALFDGPTQLALQYLAYLPSTGVKVEALAAFLACTENHLRALLRQVVSAGIVRVNNGEVCFSHDRHHLSALASIGDGGPKLDLLLRLANSLEETGSTEFAFVRADLLWSARDIDLASVPAESLVRATIQAVARANRSLAMDLASRYLDRILGLWPIDSASAWENHPEVTMIVVVSLAETSIAGRTAAQALPMVEKAFAAAPSTLGKIQCLTWMSRLALASNQPTEAVRCVKRSFELVSIDVCKRPKDMPSTPEEVMHLARQPAHAATTEADRIAVALSVVLMINGPTIYSFVENFGTSYFETAAAAMAKSPAGLKCPSSAYMFAIMGLLALDALNISIARAWLSLSESIDVTGTSSYASAEIARNVVRFIRAKKLRDIDYASIRRDCMASRNTDILTYVGGLEQATLVMSGHSISVLFDNAKATVHGIGDDLQPVSRLMATSFCQFADNVTSTGLEPHQLSELRGKYVSRQHAAALPETAPFYAIVYCLANALLGMLCDIDLEAQRKRRQDLRHFRDGGNGTILQPFAALLLGVGTLLDDAETEQDLVQSARTFMLAFEQNVSFSAMNQLLDTLQLIKEVRLGSSVAVEPAISGVEHCLVALEEGENHLYQGLLCAQMAKALRIVDARLWKRVADGYRSSAGTAYSQCGAVALAGIYFRSDVVAQDVTEHHTHTSISSENVIQSDLLPTPTAEPSVVLCSNESTMGVAWANKRQGFETVLRSLMVVASERDSSGLIKRMLEIAMSMTRTSWACLAIHNQSTGTLRLRGAGSLDSLATYDQELSQAADICPSTIILHSCVTKRSINTDHDDLAKFNNLMSRDRYISSKETPRAVLVSPLFVQNEVSGVLYLSSKTPTTFKMSSQVLLLATFAASVLEAHQAYAALETAVESRTQQLESALAHRSLFLSGISHELRTPLHSIASTCSIMACSTDLAPADRENLDVVQTSTNDLTRIINSVLDYSRLEAGAIDIESIEFDLRDVIENAAATVGHIAQAKKLEVLVESTVDADPKHVLLGDPHRLRQALLNILGNAIKFTPALASGDKKSPVIKIRWTLEDKGNNMEICIACEDSGIGINRKALAKIFSPFTQADAGISRRFEGSGLGLSITRGLCRAMGGDCWVESVEGVGSTFYCLIIVKKNGPVKENKWALPAAKHKTGVFYTSNSVCAGPVSSHLRLFGVDMAATETFDAEPDPKNHVDIAIIDAGITQKAQICELGMRIRKVHEGVNLVIMVDPAHVETYSKDPELDGISLIIKPVKASALYRLIKQYDDTEKGVVPIAGNKSVPRDSSGRRIQTMDPKTAIDYPLRLLYVDDNLLNIKVGKKILEKFGYKDVDTAADGRIAADMAAQNKYDLVFMDLQMPVMDGYASQAAIKSDPRTGNPCIVALTANCDTATQKRCVEAGFYGFLPKPIVFPKLAALLTEVYQHRQHPSIVPHNVNNTGT